MNTQRLTPRQIVILSIVATFLLAFIYFYLRVSGIIPQPDGVIDWLQALYTNYGYWVVFLAALLEGLFIVSMYVPGSSAILLGVLFAKQSGLSIPAVVALVVIGFSISLSCNYLLGRHGIYTLLKRLGYNPELADESKAVVQRSTFSLFASFIHPNIATMMSVGAGIITMPYRRFITLTVLSLLFWDSLWAIITYTAGDAALRFMASPYALFAAAFWSSVSVLVPYLQHRTATRGSTE